VLGADIVIDASAEDPAEVLQHHGGADVAIGLAVDDRSSATAYAGLRRGGRLVLVALPASGALSIPVFDTVLNGTSVIGSIVGTRARPTRTRPAGPGSSTRPRSLAGVTTRSARCCTAGPRRGSSSSRSPPRLGP
jgi:NADPH:quinone reductase-like Zn-dependent oxidoreductase